MEKKFGFTFSDTLTRATKLPFLTQYSVFLTVSIHPDPASMALICTSAGAKV